MTPPGDQHTPLPFTVALSFLLGIVTTIAVYSMRSGPAAATREPVETLPVTESVERTEPHETVPGDTVPPADVGDVETLRARDLKIPVDGVDREDLRNTFSEARGSRSHEALDIIAPRGTDVRAVEDGRIEKLFTSKAGGLTIYEFDPTETFAYYYAHLDRYADGLREGQLVRRGDVIGYVGSTGNASPDAPHLHFAIFRLGPERRWWKGKPINPYPVLAAH
jgi:murein DD-endopeptidase MepM/ murein hydrolase activator NlpD